MLPINPAIYIGRRDGKGSIISKQKVLQDIDIAIRTNWLSFSQINARVLLQIR
jgi:hypothetical protein